MIRFHAKVLRPASQEEWTFIRLTDEASKELPSRGMVSVEGTIGNAPFQATLEPDGQGGHWLKIKPDLLQAAGANPGDMVALAIMPMSQEPEPEVPDDFATALASAPDKARMTWADITPAARRDWIFWITSGKKAETRANRILVACDKLAKGNRRACCFDRSGMYSKSLSCPVAQDDQPS
ncbi:MAG: DUF1905 domain-containing protein [Chthonomonas sp.]|nr:DUF1905 domain-containing protein [Chthonomonas sp.]